MFRLNARFTFMLLMVLTAGCAKFESADYMDEFLGSISLAVKPYGTCDRSAVVTINICVEMVGSDYNDPGYLAILQSSCQSTGGVFSTNNCNRSTSFGTCAIYPGQSNQTHVHYYAPLYDATTARSACEATPGGYYLPN